MKNKVILYTVGVMLGGILGWVAVDKLAGPYLRELGYKHGFEKNANEFFEDMNKQMSQFSTEDEFQNFAKAQINDKEVAAVSSAVGFLESADIIRDFCVPTGYTPEKFIKMLYSHKTDVDLEAESLKILGKKGLQKDQVIFILENTKKLIAQQVNRVMEDEYQMLKNQNPAYSKTEYCKIYDQYAEDIIAGKLNEIKKNFPDQYEKYFKD